MSFLDPRRLAPRIAVDGLCGVVAEHELQPASLVELSSIGLRIELPFDRSYARDTLQLEIELPGIDEIVWARGRVTFAHLSPMRGRHADCLRDCFRDCFRKVVVTEPRLWCRAGVHIEAAAGRERRLLRDYVVETRRARRTQLPHEGIEHALHAFLAAA